MRIELPQCDFSDCRRRFDGNCRSKEDFKNCQYQQLRSASLQIEHVSSEDGDWQGLYVNETLVCEGHSLLVYKVVSGINQFLPLDYAESGIPKEVAEQGLPSFREYPFKEEWLK